MAGKNTIIPKRGDMFIVNFDPAIGSEIKKTRPALILQNDIANEHSSVTIVAAITTHDLNDGLYPTEVLVKTPEGGLANDSVILLNQLRTIDKERLVHKLGSVDMTTMLGVARALEISLGTVEVREKMDYGS